MGADCCGGTEAVEAAFAAATLEQHGDAPNVAQSEKTFEQAVQERLPYYQKRIGLFEQYKKRHDENLEAAKAANVPITVTLPDGSTKPGVQNVTTPLDIATSISKSLAKKVLVASVDDKPWDLFRPLDGDCSMKLHTFDDPEGKDVCGRCLVGVFCVCMVGHVVWLCRLHGIGFAASCHYFCHRTTTGRAHPPCTHHHPTPTHSAFGTPVPTS